MPSMALGVPLKIDNAPPDLKQNNYCVIPMNKTIIFLMILVHLYR